jgi:hypothetical protein
MRTNTAKLADALDVLAREIHSDDGVANAAIAEAAQRLRELRAMEDAALHPIDALPNDGVRVVLLKRTGKDTVMAAIGYRDSAGNVRGWIGKRGPTHWVKAPPASARFS